LESNAFELVRAGRTEDAQTILSGETYRELQRLDEEGMREFAISVDAELGSLREAQSGRLRLLIFGLVVAIAISLIAWAVVLRSLRTRHAALQRSIAERERAVAELAESEARFRDFGEAACDWFWETDDKLTLTYVSPTFQEITGRSPEMVLGKARWEVLGIDTEADELWHDHRADMEAHRPFRDFRYSYVDGEGRGRHRKVSGKPVFDETGAFRGYRGSGLDITAEVEAELRAERAESRLLEALEVNRRPAGPRHAVRGYRARRRGTQCHKGIGRARRGVDRPAPARSSPAKPDIRNATEGWPLAVGKRAPHP
jgi:PAS domain S-box-containing protein